MLKIEDLFEIDTKDIPIQKPINRIAYTSEDVTYKLKCIKAMYELGMEVIIDKIGNICGILPGQIRTDKSIVCESHTDSVNDGGQFDGPLGVYAALKTAEDIIKNGKPNAINYKVIIFACEESTSHEGKACLGSKYSRGDNLDFEKIKNRDGISLKDEVATFKKELFEAIEKAGLKPLKEVDNVIQNGEVITAIEGHIEQADSLREHGKNIGLCSSIVAPYRLKANITDIKTAAKFICRLNEVAKQPENLSKYRITIPEFSIKEEYDKDELKNKKIIAVRITGKNNHSGATPMDRRKDAVYGAAKFIELLSDNPDVQFLETCTPTWGANQINDCCILKFATNLKGMEQVLLAKKDAISFAKVRFKRVDNNKKKQDKESGLFIDVRQQLGMTPELSSEMIFETAKDIVHQTNMNVYMNVTSKGEPCQTNHDLIEIASQICKEKEIPYEITRSWAGHDLQTLTNDENVRRLLIFCDNSGGSHNPQETTTLDSVQKLVDVESSLARKELERLNELYLKSTYESLIDQLSSVKNLAKIWGISLENSNEMEKD